jgi:ribosomal protein S18 acetylase RimI-like enzyme
MVGIRCYTPGDREVLRKMVLELHEGVRLYDPDLVLGRDFLEGYFEQLIAKQAGSAGGIYLAVTPEEGLLGYVVIYGRLHPPATDERPDPYAWVAELYVRESHRDQGLGEALLARAEAHARDLGVYKIEMSVVSGNAAARRFYERLGYRDRSLTMSKRLDPES